MVLESFHKCSIPKSGNHIKASNALPLLVLAVANFTAGVKIMFTLLLPIYYAILLYTINQ